MIGALVAGQVGSGGAVLASFESIATTNISGTNTLTFSSIPSDFKHLQIRGFARTSNAVQVAGAMILRANSDTGSNYAQHSLYGNGSSAIASGSASTTSIDIHSQIPGDSSTASTMGVMIIDILDYGSTTKNKTVRSFWGADANTASTNWRVGINSGVWMNTSAITSLTIVFPANPYGADNSFALYGIKEA
jgi:hypothetical protein